MQRQGQGTMRGCQSLTEGDQCRDKGVELWEGNKVLPRVISAETRAWNYERVTKSYRRWSVQRQGRGTMREWQSLTGGDHRDKGKELWEGAKVLPRVISAETRARNYERVTKSYRGWSVQRQGRGTMRGWQSLTEGDQCRDKGKELWEGDKVLPRVISAETRARNYERVTKSYRGWSLQRQGQGTMRGWQSLTEGDQCRDKGVELWEGDKVLPRVISAETRAWNYERVPKSYQGWSVQRQGQGTMREWQSLTEGDHRDKGKELWEGDKVLPRVISAETRAWNYERVTKSYRRWSVQRQGRGTMRGWQSLTEGDQCRDKGKELRGWQSLTEGDQCRDKGKELRGWQSLTEGDQCRDKGKELWEGNKVLPRVISAETRARNYERVTKSYRGWSVQRQGQGTMRGWQSLTEGDQCRDKGKELWEGDKVLPRVISAETRARNWEGDKVLQRVISAETRAWNYERVTKSYRGWSVQRQGQGTERVTKSYRGWSVQRQGHGTMRGWQSLTEGDHRDKGKELWEGDKVLPRVISAETRAWNYERVTKSYRGWSVQRQGHGTMRGWQSLTEGDQCRDKGMELWEGDKVLPRVISAETRAWNYERVTKSYRGWSVQRQGRGTMRG